MAATTGPIPAALVASFQTSSWIWTPETDLANAPAGIRAFRRTYTPPAGKSPSSALVLITVDNLFSLFVNGQFAGAPPNTTDVWKQSQIFNVPLNPGPNLFAVITENLRDATTGKEFGAAGLLAAIQVTFSDGTTSFIKSDASWRGVRTVPQDFAAPTFDDSPWNTAVVITPYGTGVWGSQVSLPSPNAIPPLLSLSVSSTSTTASTPTTR